jgi:integrase
MARSAKHPKLDSRTARFKLAEGLRTYISIGEGLSLGYRRTSKGYGNWEVRYRANGKYTYTALGEADDFQDANGATVLTYFQAQEKARQAANLAKITEGVIAKPFTVDQAATNYLQWYSANRKAYTETKNTADTHILPIFGKKLVSEITTRQIKDWHQKLASTPPRRRSGVVGVIKFADMPTTEEGKRSRKSTANRILTVLKAILNKAFNDDLTRDDTPWRKVRPFPNTDEPITRFLTVTESTRLINACPADLRQLVKAALFTGARFGELARLKVGQINIDTHLVYISPESKSGKGRHIPLHEDALDFFKSLTVGKSGTELVLQKNDGKPWGKNHHVRPLLEACKNAKINPPISFHELRHTYASTLAQLGVDLLTISKLLGHADTRITSRHYAHLCDNTLKVAVDKLPSFGHIKDIKVATLELAA